MDEKEDFLSRWSRRKRQSASSAAEDRKTPVAVATPAAPVVAAGAAAPAAREPLPPIDSLTPESDFHPFMRPEVDEGLKRLALKTLFQDPHFNTMDMLDTYVDDYSKPDPLPEGWLAQLRQTERLGHYQAPVGPDPEAAAEEAETEEKLAVEQGVEQGAPESIADTEMGVGEAPEMGESTPDKPAPG